MTGHRQTTEIEAIRTRLEANLWAWGWHPEGALDPDGSPVHAGYGHHMSQMLARLPRDGQTDDMRRSIQSMLGDLHTLLALRTSPAPVLADLPEPKGNHCPGCGWSSGGHDPRCPAIPTAEEQA